MRLNFFVLVLICVFIGLISCGKEPKKGSYTGVFNGRYSTDIMTVAYTTNYKFEVVKSTKKELKLKEEDSKIISNLKKHDKDSVSGVIGFGSISIIGENRPDGLSTIYIRGIYDKKSIYGVFSTTFSDGNKDYLSEGKFVISQ